MKERLLRCVRQLLAQSCRPWRQVGVRQLPEVLRTTMAPTRSSFVRDPGYLCPNNALKPSSRQGPRRQPRTATRAAAVRQESQEGA